MMQVSIKSIRRHMVQPQFTTHSLKVNKLLIREFGMKIQQNFRRVGQVLQVNPWEEGLVINFILERQQAIGVDEDWDAPQAQRLVKADREVATTAHAQGVVGAQDVVDEFDFGGMLVGLVLVLSCMVAPAGDEVGLNPRLMGEGAQDPRAEGGGLERGRLPGEHPPAVLAPLPLQAQGTKGSLHRRGTGLPAESDNGDFALGAGLELPPAVKMQVVGDVTGLGGMVAQAGRGAVTSGLKQGHILKGQIRRVVAAAEDDRGLTVLMSSVDFSLGFGHFIVVDII